MRASLTGLIACEKSFLADWAGVRLIRSYLANRKTLPFMATHSRGHAYRDCSIFQFVVVLRVVQALTLRSLNDWDCFAGVLPC
jgi:hypothetical protein